MLSVVALSKHLLSYPKALKLRRSIHAVDKNMFIKNVVICYRNRPDGSESKLNKYSDGIIVLFNIF